MKCFVTKIGENGEEKEESEVEAAKADDTWQAREVARNEDDAGRNQ